MDEEISADMGMNAVAHDPAILVAFGLGSCIACAIWDKKKNIGGLAHVMLPQSGECFKGNGSINMNKFADIAIPNLIESMKQKGCNVENMVAKIAGGAHMFRGIIESETIDIGKRNDDAVKSELHKLGIPIIASDTGGNTGRTVRLDTANGKMIIKTKEGIKEI